jgi:hypothetical protein
MQSIAVSPINTANHFSIHFDYVECNDVRRMISTLSIYLILHWNLLKIKAHASDVQTFLSLFHLISKANDEEKKVEKLRSDGQIQS